MLTNVQISKFRCLKSVDVPLKPLTVLIGANNTGKTAFLKAIQLLGTAPHKDKIKGNSVLSVDQNDLWKFSTGSLAELEGKTLDEHVVTVKRCPESKLPSERMMWCRVGDNRSILPLSLFENETLNPAMSSRGLPSTRGVPLIDNKISNIPAYLDALLRKDRDRFFRILDTLKENIPGLVDIRIETPEPESRRIDLLMENNVEMRADLASYGVRLLIFFVALANHPEPPKTILIEEPETGVHPKRLESIVKLLRGLTEGRYSDHRAQVILSTHSPYLLDVINPETDQVLVFERAEDGSRTAKPVDTERLKVFLDEFMLGEIWSNQEESGLVAKDS